MKQTHSLVTTVVFFSLLIKGTAYTKEDRLEHPVIKPMPGYQIIQRISKKDPFGILAVKIRENNKTTRKKVDGQFWRLSYNKLDKNPVSTGEIIGNYQSAILEKGGKITFTSKKDLLFSVPRKDGGIRYATMHIAYSYYEIKIFDQKSLKTVLSFGAEELKKHWIPKAT